MAIRPSGGYGLSRITPTQYALGQTEEVLGRGFRDIGESRLRSSEMGLRRAKSEFEMDKFARYEQPDLEAKKAHGDAHSTFGDYNKDEPMSIHFAQYLAEPLSKFYGGEVDTSDGTFRIKKKDGSYVTNRERALRANEEKGLVLSKMKISSTLRDQMARYENKMMALEAQGAVDTPEYQRLVKNVKKTSFILGPEGAPKMIKILENQKKVLQGIGHYPKEIQRINGEIAAYKKQIGEIAGKQYERETKLMVEKAKAKGDVKPTALMKNVPFVSETLGISRKDATKILTQSKSKSDEELISTLTATFLRQDEDLKDLPDELEQKVRSALDVIRKIRGEEEVERESLPYVPKEELEKREKIDPLGIR